MGRVRAVSKPLMFLKSYPSPCCPFESHCGHRATVTATERGDGYVNQHVTCGQCAKRGTISTVIASVTARV